MIRAAIKPELGSSPQAFQERLSPNATFAHSLAPQTVCNYANLGRINEKCPADHDCLAVVRCGTEYKRPADGARWKDSQRVFVTEGCLFVMERDVVRYNKESAAYEWTDSRFRRATEISDATAIDLNQRAHRELFDGTQRNVRRVK